MLCYVVCNVVDRHAGYLCIGQGAILKRMTSDEKVVYPLDGKVYG